MELDDDALPEEVVAQLQSSDHVSHTFNPATARARDMCAAELESRREKRPIERFQASLLKWLLGRK